MHSSNSNDNKLGIKYYISQAPEHSGVYRFYDISGKLLYVGKAKSLKHRLQSYLRPYNTMQLHIQEMVSRSVRVDWLLTSNEIEALFLEAELIENLHPIYNIQHKEGRNYTYVSLSQSDFPRLSHTRFWSPNTYGPFLSNEHVRNAIDGLYNIFQLRSCTDAVFKSRKKPCMEYDLGRCSAPCVGYISQTDYSLSVLNFKQLFTSVDNKIIDIWNASLEKAVEEENYETAAVLHKRIQSFTLLRNSVLDKAAVENAEFFISSISSDIRCVHICSVRNFIIRHKIVVFTSASESLLEFIIRWTIKNKLSTVNIIYTNEQISNDISDSSAILNKYKFKKLTPKLYPNLKQIENEGFKLAKSEIDTSSLYRSFAQRLGVKALGRVEVYDNSHMGGKWNVGVKIVWTPNGFKHTDYEIFKYADQTHDDYAMMREMFRRRFCQFNTTNASHHSHTTSTTTSNSSVKESPWPDLIIIDGGVGQLSVANSFIPPDITRYALSKHEDGDQLHAIYQNKFTLLDLDTDLRLWLMKLRDEAHRFAVHSHSQLKESSIS